MSLEKEFEELFKKSHDYLDKSNQLRLIYITKKERGIAKGYAEILLNEIHLIEPLLKKYPNLKNSFKYTIGSKRHDQASEMYNETIENPPKDITQDQICTYKILWEGVHISRALDVMSKLGYNISVLEQSLVAMCTAFECYCKDSTQWIIDNIPDYSKKYLGSLTMPTKELGKHDFEPLKNAGNIFNEKEGKGFKIFDDGKKIYSDIIGFDLFENEKHEMTIWKIFQTRHCIIHNGGKPDLLWKQKTKGAKFKKDVATLNSYIEYLHEEYHSLFYRLYLHLFNKKPTVVIPN